MWFEICNKLLFLVFFFREKITGEINDWFEGNIKFGISSYLPSPIKSVVPPQRVGIRHPHKFDPKKEAMYINK